MRSLALLCLLALATPAYAATPEQHYLDLHDRYIAKFSKAPENDETSKQHDAALRELTTVLRSLVGPVAIKGLPADGKTNADTLFKGDSGFGHLDGLGFASEGDRMQAVYAELPITKPAGVSAAVTVLGVRGNGDLKGPPHEIDVVAIQGEKVFFIAASDAVKTAEIPACEKVWKQMMARLIDKKDPRGDITREDNAMTAYTMCFAKAAPSQSWFAAAVKKAQSQLDLLPLR
ncbi:hypothetical protein IVB27_24140 [Bradyrhizobium sp. 197]|jgi:hypothetical protein|uniref:hypothetical protein n=1 Tax=Bradyrhizobium sp. 197 TaxID=2782663 RepID=UPI001FFC0D15|nr:hypothetical protein [Bradyrhizobium sp. 197]MCK1477808.1 hypothetical protein [Bradyrhizobium sp. 197]